MKFDIVTSKTSKEKATRMMNIYMAKFLTKLAIFLCVLAAYITNKPILLRFMTHEFTFGISKYGISPLHVLWVIFMIPMIRHLKPKESFSMAMKKSKEMGYQENEHFNDLELLKFVQKANLRAWHVMLVWLTFNAFFGLLYVLGFMDSADLLMLSVFYFLCDYICIVFFCPFQSFIMKNKCCVNCRIYDWGHFMMFFPMLYIRNFFSWSLFFTSLIVLLRWEIVYAAHPEWFWSGSNESLQCENCKDKICKYKKVVNVRNDN